jgi:hypothetical protein
LFILLQLVKNPEANYEPILAFPFAQSPPAALADARHSSGVHPPTTAIPDFHTWKSGLRGELRAGARTSF